MGKQIADSSRPTTTTVSDNDYYITQRGVGGTNYRITGASLKAELRKMSDWAAGGYVAGQRVQYHNLQLEATTGFTSANPLTELADATPKWKVVGGFLEKNVIANAETYVVPKNFTCRATNMVNEGTIEIMDNAYLRVEGELDNESGTINETGTGQVILKPL